MASDALLWCLFKHVRFLTHLKSFLLMLGTLQQVQADLQEIKHSVTVDIKQQQADLHSKLTSVVDMAETAYLAAFETRSRSSHSSKCRKIASKYYMAVDGEYGQRNRAKSIPTRLLNFHGASWQCVGKPCLALHLKPITMLLSAKKPGVWGRWQTCCG